MNPSGGLAPRKPTLGAVLKKMSGALHHHPCTACRSKFSCSCSTPTRNGRCHACREFNARPRPIWDQAGDPAGCCWSHCVLMTDTTVLAAYKLAGPGPWFGCPTCKRAHGYQPRR